MYAIRSYYDTRWGEALYYHYQGRVLSGHPILSGDWCARFVC